MSKIIPKIKSEIWNELKDTPTVKCHWMTIDGGDNFDFLEFVADCDYLLHYAAQIGDCRAIELLLDAGMDVDKPGCMGYTALDYAKREGHEDVVQLLLKRGASRNIRAPLGVNVRMHTKHEDPAEKMLIKHIRNRFPVEALQTDKWLAERHYDQQDIEEMTYVWMESFADRTREAVLQHNATKIKELTGFIAEQYRTNSDILHNIIDIAYAENIMWGVDNSDRVWAWPHIAEEVRQLYEAMFGTPNEQQGTNHG
jgi:hypothetical protein